MKLSQCFWYSLRKICEYIRSIFGKFIHSSAWVALPNWPVILNSSLKPLHSPHSSFLPTANEVGDKVLFLQLSLCPWGEVLLSHLLLWTAPRTAQHLPPPAQHLPPYSTSSPIAPPCTALLLHSAPSPRSTSGGMHPTGMLSCFSKLAQSC